MKEPTEDFADQLGRYLVRAGFTQQELAHKIGMHRNTIVKWMNRTSRPTSCGQVLRLADELSLVKEERKAFLQAAGFSLERWPTEVWTVPVPRDMFFTGRDEVFRSLRELLIPGSTMALTQAISGLGGIGKTHTAVEYAYRFHREYEAVLWLQADSWETLVSACIQLADELALPEQEEADQVVAEVQRWLRKHRSWLLILDNAELYREQGKYREAAPLYQRAIRIWRRALGPDYPELTFPLRGLAELYHMQGNYRGAEPLYQQALHIGEQVWGPEHRQLAGLLSCLANLYREQGKFGEAESLYQRALRMDEQAVNETHPAGSPALQGLAELYSNQG